MRKIFSLAILIFILIIVSPAFPFAQGMPALYQSEAFGLGMENIMDENNVIVQNDDGHTAREEAEGKAIWEKLQVKELKCENLTDDDFGALGEYFMGQMTGDSHEAMNNMMIQMMEKEGEEKMHIVMGKRMSGCEPTASMPQNMMKNNMMPMMENWSNPGALNNYSNNPMMNFGSTPFAWFGWIFMILFWVLIVVGIIALIKWLAGEIGSGRKEKSPLDILKERYAKGEIDKKEFEERRKDLI